MLFRCNACRRTYHDYQPIDDTCAKCGKGSIKWVEPKRMQTTGRTAPHAGTIRQAFKADLKAW